MIREPVATETVSSEMVARNKVSLLAAMEHVEELAVMVVAIDVVYENEKV